MRLSAAGQRTSVDGLPQIGGHYVLAFLQGTGTLGERCLKGKNILFVEMYVMLFFFFDEMYDLLFWGW